jgi:hypothetical protein
MQKNKIKALTSLKVVNTFLYINLLWQNPFCTWILNNSRSISLKCKMFTYTSCFTHNINVSFEAQLSPIYMYMHVNKTQQIWVEERTKKNSFNPLSGLWHVYHEVKNTYVLSKRNYILMLIWGKRDLNNAAFYTRCCDMEHDVAYLTYGKKMYNVILCIRSHLKKKIKIKIKTK